MKLPPAFLATLAALFAFTRLRKRMLLAAHVFGNIECVAEPSDAAIIEYLSYGAASSSSSSSSSLKSKRRRRAAAAATSTASDRVNAPDVCLHPASSSSSSAFAAPPADGELQLVAFPARSYFDRQRDRRQQLAQQPAALASTPASVAAALRQRRAQQLQQLDLLPYQYELELQCALLAHLALLTVVAVAMVRFPRAAEAIQYAALVSCVSYVYVNAEMLRDVGWSAGESKASLGVAFVGFILAAAAAAAADAGDDRRHRKGAGGTYWHFSLLGDALERAAAQLARVLGQPVLGVKGALRLVTAMMAALLGACTFIPAVRRARYFHPGAQHAWPLPRQGGGGERRRTAQWCHTAAIVADLFGGVVVSLLWLRPFRRVPSTARAVVCAAYAVLRLGMTRTYLQVHMYGPLRVLRALRRMRGGARQGSGGGGAAAAATASSSSRPRGWPLSAAEKQRIASDTLARIRGVRLYMCSTAIQYGGVPATLLVCAAMVIAATCAGPSATMMTRGGAVGGSNGGGGGGVMTATLLSKRWWHGEDDLADEGVAVRVLAGMGDVWMWWLLIADGAIVMGTLEYSALESALGSAARRAATATVAATTITAAAVPAFASL